MENKKKKGKSAIYFFLGLFATQSKDLGNSLSRKYNLPSSILAWKAELCFLGGKKPQP